MDAAEELDLQFRLRGVGRAFGDEHQSVVDGARHVDVRVADVVVRLGERGHHVRRVAAGRDHVMNPRTVRRVLPEKLGAVVQDRHRVERRPARLWRRGRMGAPPAVAELGRHPGQVRRIAGGVPVTRMPVQNRVDVVEQAGPGHERLRAAAFLGGRAVEPDRSLNRAATDAVGHREGSAQRAGAEQVMAAGVAPVRSLARRTGGNGLLRQSRQGVELGQNRDDRLARAEGGDEAGRNAGDPARDLEPLLLDEGGEQGRRLRFLVARLGPLPDLSRGVPEQIGPLRHRSLQTRLLRHSAGGCRGERKEKEGAAGNGGRAHPPIHRTR